MAHDWEQVSTSCMTDQRHLWKCRKCGEWTRNRTQPLGNAELEDPEHHREKYWVDNQCNPFGRIERMMVNARFRMKLEFLYVVESYQLSVEGLLIPMEVVGESMAMALFNLNYYYQPGQKEPDWKPTWLNYDEIERHCQLHERLVIERAYHYPPSANRITGEVRGFSVQLLYQDSAILGPRLTGTSIEEAMDLMRVYLKDEPRDKIRAKFKYHNPDY